MRRLPPPHGRLRARARLPPRAAPSPSRSPGRWRAGTAFATRAMAPCPAERRSGSKDRPGAEGGGEDHPDRERHVARLATQVRDVAFLSPARALRPAPTEASGRDEAVPPCRAPRTRRSNRSRRPGRALPTSVVLPLKLRPGSEDCSPVMADRSRVHEHRLRGAERDLRPDLRVEHSQRHVEVGRHGDRLPASHHVEALAGVPRQ